MVVELASKLVEWDTGFDAAPASATKVWNSTLGDMLARADGVKESSEYPDVPAKEYMLKVEEGEEPPPTLDSLPALEPSSWKSYTDDEGKTYYANEATGETSWSLPEGGSVTRG